MNDQQPLFQTLAEQLREKDPEKILPHAPGIDPMQETRKPQRIIMSTEPPREAYTLYQDRKHSGDPRQILKDLTARQTELLNTNAPEEQRIAVYKEIQAIQKKRGKQE